MNINGRRCSRCGEVIPDQLRRDAKYCSDKCKQAAAYRRRIISQEA